MRMTPFGKLLDPMEARRRLLSVARPVSRVEALPLPEGLGRVVAVTVRSPEAIPAFRRASWDGYALRSRETKGAADLAPARFRLVGELHAEEGFPRPLRPGEAVAVATGAPLPRGADAVAIFEDTRSEDGVLEVFHPVEPGRAVAERGEDIRRGEVLVRTGELLTPARIGSLGAVGERTVEVFGRVRVALLPNGNELVPPDRTPGPGQIREFNNLTLGSFIRGLGGEATALPPAPDDPREIERRIRDALEGHDMVWVTGGSSVGERDFLPRVLPRVGRMLFHGLSIRPGKPTLAAVAGGKIVLGLPGHPTSCLSNAFWLLVPLLERVERRREPILRERTVRLASPYGPTAPGFTSVLPLRLENGWGHPTYRGSAAITSLVGAGAFALLPGGKPRLARGRPIKVWELPPPVG